MARVQYPLQSGAALSDYLGQHPSLLWWGAKGDTQIFAASCTSGSPVVTSVPRTGTGTLSSSGATVTGTGTSFLAEIQVGTFITADAQTRKVLAVISDTELLTATAFSPALSADAFTIFVGFDAEDVGKRIVVHGAGAGGDRESVIAGGTGYLEGTADTFGVVSGSESDTQAGTTFKVCCAARVRTLVWEVYGSNAADYTGESVVHGPEDVVNAAASVSFIDATPGFRYYRVKVKNKVAGQIGVAYVAWCVLGRILGAEIATVDSESQVTLDGNCGATKSSTYAYFGTDDTVAIQKAIDVGASLVPAGTADGGVNIQIPRGVYLISAPITHRACVVLKGPSGGAAIFKADGESFPIDTPVWNMTGLWNGANIAFFTRLEDCRIDCSDVPGSIGVFADALQENSGLRRVAIDRWRKYGLQAGSDAARYGCSNWLLDDLWIVASRGTFLEADARGLVIVYAPGTMLNRSTIYGNAPNTCGFGKCVDIDLNSAIDIHHLHMESAEMGIHFQSGSGGVAENLSALLIPSVIELDTQNPVTIRNCKDSNDGNGACLTDNITGVVHADAWLSEFKALSAPMRLRGGNQVAQPILEIYPEDLYNGSPAVKVDERGNLQVIGFQVNPNVFTRDAANFAGEDQGGFDSVNSRFLSFPTWGKTSTNVSTLAAFIRNAATKIEWRFGKADQPVYVAQGTCNVSGTAFTKVTGDNLDTGWPAGTQVVIGSTIYTFASVTSTTAAVLSTSGGTQTGAFFGVSTDDEALGGTEPGKTWGWIKRNVGTWFRRIYTNGSNPIALGNEEATGGGTSYRMRFYHGEAGQRYLVLQDSNDGGSAWTYLASFDLQARALILHPLTAARPMRTGTGGVVTTGPTAVDDANEVAASSLTSGRWVKWTTKLESGAALTNARPVLGDANGNPVTGDINVGDAAHVTLPGGAANGDVAAYWDGSFTFYTLAGLASNLQASLKTYFDTIYAAKADYDDHAHTVSVAGTTGTTSGHDHSFADSVTSSGPV